MSYADRDKYGMYRNSGGTGPGPALMGANTLIGDGVVNAQDAELGDIKEIMLDMQTGQVAYAVLAFGGFLGMGEKLFAVPWQALHLDTANQRFVLDVDKERLQTAPGFDKDAWPDMSDAQWTNAVHTFYGTDPHRAGGPTMGAGSGAPMGGMPGGAGTASGMGAGMGSPAAGHAGGTEGAGSFLDSGAGVSTDPRAGNEGGDTDLSRIRGSNIG